MKSLSDALWPQPRPLSAAALLELGIALSRLCATRHANGLAGGLEDAFVDDDGALRLGAPNSDVQPADDVRLLGRVLMEGALRRTPNNQSISDAQLLSHLTLVAPDLPPALLSVMADATALHPAFRPANGTEMWLRLAHAQAHMTVREDAPDNPGGHWSVGHDTHIGALKSRMGQTNQDALFYQTSGNLTLLLVADGISTSTIGSGNLASALTVQVVARRWAQHHERLQKANANEMGQFLDETLARANRAVCEAAVKLSGGQLQQQIPMGTTAILALLRGNRIYLASLGDSRAYLIGAHGVALLTGDQNVRGEWLRSWQTALPLPPQQEGNALVSYIGHFDVDHQPVAIPPQRCQVQALPGESLLLCSDGLSDYAADCHAELHGHIQRISRQHDPTTASRKLVDLANEGGGGDNVTVLLASLTSHREDGE